MPDQFYRLTIYEFDQLSAAYDRRCKTRLRQEATWVVALMNATGNYETPVTVDRILGGKDEKSQKKADDEIEKLKLRAETRRQQRLKERGLRDGTITG